LVALLVSFALLVGFALQGLGESGSSILDAVKKL